MLVYGIRCDQSDLSCLPKDTVADYYLDYGLLVFPSYSKPTCISTGGTRITAEFLHMMRLIVEQRKSVIAMEFEHPYLSEAETLTLKTLQTATGKNSLPDWYHVPRIVTADSIPHIVIS